MISCKNTDLGSIFFRGKAHESAPLVGRPPYDSEIITTLGRLAKSKHFVYPHSDHSGEVIEVGANGSGAIIGPGDAFIIRPGSPIKTGFIRTRDCVPTLGFIGGHSFGIHSSNITEFGWNLPNNNGFVPISRKVLTRVAKLAGENMDKCQLYLGPCIAGTQNNGCACYGYTETKDSPDGTKLIQLIQNCYPEVDLEGLFFRDDRHDKIFFNWGALFAEIFKTLGIPENNIHTGFNYCTLCNHHEWWSTRFSAKQTDMESKQLHEKVGPSNLAWISRV